MKSLSAIQQRRNRPSPAFTLIELMIAITVFIIMSVLLFTALFNNYREAQSIRHGRTPALVTTAVPLGPMLSDEYLPDPLARQTVVRMRAWVRMLKPSDAKTLNHAGKITFVWADMTNSYPDQALIIDDYQEQRREGIVEALKQNSKPIPERLATYRCPDTVEIAKKPRGECWVVFSSATGIAHNYLEIAAPLPK